MQQDIYQLKIDGTKTVAELVKDCNFDQPTDRVNNFKPKYNTQRNATGKIFTFHGYKSTEEVIEAMKKEKFRPAVIEELLAFGSQCAHHYKSQSLGRTVALGSTAKDTHTKIKCCASLYYNVDSLLGFSGKVNTVLTIDWNRPEQNWHPSYYFLGILEE